MSLDTKQVYGLTESQYYRLYQAEHLLKFIDAVAERKTDENPLLNQIESESFCVVMGLIRDLIDTDSIKGIQEQQA